MSVGAFVLGLLNGLTIGLLAVGLVLVYKSNRFLNLAHAQLGTLSAVLVAKFVIDWGWSFWLAFPIALAVGLATGLAVDRFLVGPMRRRTSSPVKLLLLSLGVSQLLLALTYIPSLGPDTGQTTLYPQPFTSNLRIGDVTLTGMYVLTAVLVPLVVGGLAAFMRYSITGKQIRAAANNPDAAELAGISVRRVSAITWGIAGALSALTAVLQAPTQPSFNVASLGPSLLMLTLGAAAFGAFVSLPGALAGGILLGVLRQTVAAITSSGSQAQLFAFLLILAIVMVRSKAIGRVFEVSGAVVEDLPPTRVPRSLRDVPVVRHHRTILAVGALAIGLVVPHLPWFATTGDQFLLTLVLVYAVLGVALTVLIGWGGQVSLGHFAVVGLGAYLTARWSGTWSLLALLLVTGAIGALAMVVVGLPALRVRGLTLAATTLGFAVIASEWLYLQPWIGTDQPFGLAVDLPAIGAGLGGPASSVGTYRVALGVLALCVFACGALRRSSPGRLFLVVRDNEKASAAFGFNPATVKLSVLAVSGFFAGAAGVLWAMAWRAVSPTQFTPDFSMAIVAVPVVGGLGSIGGAVAAAVMLYGGTFFVGPLASGLFGDYGQNLGFSLFLAGASQILVLMQFPTGVAGAVQARWQAYLDRRAGATEVEPDLGAPVDVPAPSDDAGGRETAPALRRAVPGALPLQVEGLRVAFGGVVAVDEPTIEVRAGEIVGLIGTNGAGKSTLMNAISGAIRPEAGSVLLFGNEVADLPPDLRAGLGLSRSFQEATLFAGLTVAETLQAVIAKRHKVGVISALLGAPWVRVSEARTRREAEAIARRFGLGPWLDVRSSELSTGTRRICELAAQVAARPQLVLLDEPTAGVAQREAEAFGPLLRSIRDELDCAVLIVEHDMPLLMGICDRMYALEAGAVIAEGTPAEIRENPRVIASYLGTDETAITRSGTKAAAASKEHA